MQSETLVANIIRDICELPDYQSPDDQPDLVMATVEELTIILDRNLSALEPTPPAESDGLVERLTTMYSHRGDGIPTQYVNPDGPEAAHHIAAQDAEIARLREALEFLADKVEAAISAVDKHNLVHGTFLGGPAFFQLASGLGKARSALNPETDHD